MANPADIKVPAEANPAVVNVGPWVTFVVNDKDGIFRWSSTSCYRY